MSERDFPLPMSDAAAQFPIGAELPCEPPAAEVAGTASREKSRLWLELLKWAFSFPALLATALVGAAFYRARQFILDPDVWWHIKNGETILATHRWPTSDPYSFTVHGFPWIAFEWLGEVLLAFVFRLGGVRGLEFLLFVLGSAILLALYAYGTICSGKSKAGFLAAALLMPLVASQFNMRPQMVGYLFLVLTMIILARFRQGKPGTLWLLPLLMLVWINSHGSWVIGMGVLFAYWIAGLFEFQVGGIEAKKWSPMERQQISFAFLLSLALLPVNPYGTELPAFPFRVAAGYPVAQANVLEWHPMPFNEAGGKLFLILVLGFVVLQIAGRFSWRLEELALCLFGIATACIHVRFVLLFVPFFTPFLAGVFARWLPVYFRDKDKYILNGILMASVVAAVVHYYPTQANLEKQIVDRFPVKAVEYIRQHPAPSPMFDSYAFGGYLVWSGQRVFIDGRGELYEDGGVMLDYVQLVLLRPGGLDVLRRYQIQSCLLERDEPLGTVLAALPEWQKVYSDTTSTLFVRRSTAPASAPQSEKQRPAHGE